MERGVLSNPGVRSSSPRKGRSEKKTSLRSASPPVGRDAGGCYNHHGQDYNCANRILLQAKSPTQMKQRLATRPFLGR
eukprot:scaffold3413_cov153-Skeletonema_dohrnii-CCMP3373.AAC.6